jgi:hypothetical protein
MADFGDVDDETDDQAAEEPKTIGQAPAIRGGLLSPSTFPSIWLDGARSDEPALAPQPPILSGPLDQDVHAEVLQDILDAQARLPPLTSGQRSGDPASWDAGWLDPPAPQITGPLDSDTRAEVLRDIQNAQAQLPPVSPQGLYPLRNILVSDLSNPPSNSDLGSGGSGGNGGIPVPGFASCRLCHAGEAGGGGRDPTDTQQIPRDVQSVYRADD